MEGAHRGVAVLRQDVSAALENTLHNLGKLAAGGEQAAQTHARRWVDQAAYTAQAAQNQPTFLQSYFGSLVAHGGVGLAYFDSSYNSIANWTLDDSLRMGAFREVLGRSLRIC